MDLVQTMFKTLENPLIYVFIDQPFTEKEKARNEPLIFAHMNPG